MRTDTFARLEHVARTGSTSTDLVRAATAAPQEWPHLSALVADHQDAGRGRSGREWQTPPGTALTASILLRPLVEPEQLGWVTLLAGLAVARALDGWRALEDRRALACGRALEDGRAPGGQPAAPRAALKWPNDVLLRGADEALEGWGTDRKVAGILTEVVPAAADRTVAGVGGDVGPTAPGKELAGGSVRASRTAVVVGIGVNLAQGRADLPVPWATSLALAGVDVPAPKELLERIGLELALLVRSWEEAGGAVPPPAVRRAVHDACGSIGQAVRVDLPGGRTVTGTATGLDDHGHLLVRTAEGEVTVLAGDVVHLRAARTPLRADRT